jgi:prefoldin subunit 5
MTQTLLPGVQAAVQALEKQISTTEEEISLMRESIASRETLIRDWRRVLATLSPTTAKASSPVNEFEF